MKVLKLNHWMIAIGLVVAYLGISGAASVISAISLPGQSSASELEQEESSGSAELGLVEEISAEDWSGWFGTVQEQPASDSVLDALPAPEVSFWVDSGNIETKNPDQVASERLLPELHAAEIFYPQEYAERLAVNPTPAAPEIPVRLIIPAVKLSAPILAAEAEVQSINKENYQVWRAPDEFAVGWHGTSAPLGVAGNTVLSGHHNVHGEVFKSLVDLNPGDLVIVQSEKHYFRYVIVNRMILPEKYAPLDERLENARWILPSEDERLTLITCWPYESNTHRLILVARPEK